MASPSLSSSVARMSSSASATEFLKRPILCGVLAGAMDYYILGNSYLVAGKETGITAFPLDIINGEPYYDSNRMYHNDERRVFTRNDLKNSIFIKKGF